MVFELKYLPVGKYSVIIFFYFEEITQQNLIIKVIAFKNLKKRWLVFTQLINLIFCSCRHIHILEFGITPQWRLIKLIKILQHIRYLSLSFLMIFLVICAISG